MRAEVKAVAISQPGNSVRGGVKGPEAQRQDNAQNPDTDER
jgi:hypothetical protein